MTTPAIIDRARSARTAGPMIIVSAVAALYLLSAALLPPDVLSITDEANYVRQAQAFANGENTVEAGQVWSRERIRILPSHYPVGTSAIQAPFVWMMGWKGARMASALSLSGGVILLAWLLRMLGYSPFSALLPMTFPPALVLGRIAMSDVPSFFISTAAIASFFWGAQRGRRWWWPAAGFLAGGSTLFRETNVLVFIPLFAGAVFRADRGAWTLIAGAALGAVLRPLTAWVVFGDPWFVKHTAGFGIDHALARLVLYSFALLVLIPAAGAAVVAHRGSRRTEMILTVLLFVGFYSVYSYSGEESGGLKQLILGPRYLLPLLPVLVVATGEVWPRWWRAISMRLPLHDRALRRLRHAGIASFVLGASTAGVAANVAVARWGASQRGIVDAIYGSTEEWEPIVTNWTATAKFLHELYGARIPINRDDLDPSEVSEVIAIHGKLHLVFLDRSDSEFHRGEAARNAAFVREVARACETRLDVDRFFTPTDRLMILKVERCVDSAFGPTRSTRSQ